MNPLTLIPTIIGEGIGYFRERQQLKHQSKSERINKQSDWETKALDTSGYKDEIWTATIIAPLWIIFAGTLFGWTEVVENMIAALKSVSDLPVWYQGAIGISLSASFAVKGYSVRQAAREKEAKRAQ